MIYIHTGMWDADDFYNLVGDGVENDVLAAGQAAVTLFNVRTCTPEKWILTKFIEPHLQLSRVSRCLLVAPSLD